MFVKFVNKQKTELKENDKNLVLMDNVKFDIAVILSQNNTLPHMQSELAPLTQVIRKHVLFNRWNILQTLDRPLNIVS